jgi:hypothetical protein
MKKIKTSIVKSCKTQNVSNKEDDLLISVVSFYGQKPFTFCRLSLNPEEQLELDERQARMLLKVLKKHFKKS